MQYEVREGPSQIVIRMKRLLFIAIVYNSVKETRDLCQSLADQTPGGFTLDCLLVDNSDVPAAMVQIDALSQEFAFVSVLRPEKNLGYFPAISEALKSQARGYDQVIAGNNDLVYARDFSTRLSASAYAPNVMVVCPEIITRDGRHQNPHHKHRLNRVQRLYFDLYFSTYIVGRFVTWVKSALTRSIDYEKSITPADRGTIVAQEIDQGVGACYVLLPHFLEMIDYKLFYPAFIYGEEAYLSWQVRHAGGKMWYDPELKVWHAESATLSRMPGRKAYSYGRDAYWQSRSLL